MQSTSILHALTVLIGLVIIGAICPPQRESEDKLNFSAKVKTVIPEPSDACINPENDRVYIVSEKGLLYETNHLGVIQHKFPEKGKDYEACWYRNGKLYVSEESERKVLVINTDTREEEASYDIKCPGHKSKGIESITYNEAHKCFVVISEKNPTKLYEVDKAFITTKEVELTGFGDVSSACFFNNKLWLISDDDHCLARLNPETYEVEKKWDLDIKNPEGLFFTKDQLVVVSDDMSTLFFYPQTDLYN